MALVSLTFILFFIVVLAVYYLVPGWFQWMVLLAASVVFYFLSATPYTFIYVLLSIGTVYIATTKIEQIDMAIVQDVIGKGSLEKEKLEKKKKHIYIAALFLCVGMLAALKYMNFFLGNARMVAGLFGKGEAIPEVHWIASLGISFYTLQMVGYLTDVYWGISKAQKNIAKLALFNCYFPQIISGPISRYKELEQDLFGSHKADGKQIYLGCLRILIGFFKKLVITEHLTQVTNQIFNNPAEYGGIFVWIGTSLYVLEIYADFAGCMDIIMGVSECFGVKLPENFKTPFCSVTIQEFWQRWHITLGTWLKDYIMFPILRSNLWTRYTKCVKKKWGRRAAKLLPMFTGMLILWLGMGLWHGGGWNYIGEGIWFWSVIVIGQTLEPWLKKAVTACKIKADSKAWYCFRCVRTTAIFTVGILFFKAENLTMAFRMLISGLSFPQIIRTIQQLPSCVRNADAVVGTMQLVWHLLSVVFGIITLILMGRMDKREFSFREWVCRKPILVQAIMIYAILFSIILLGAYGPGYTSAEFIYGGF